MTGNTPANERTTHPRLRLRHDDAGAGSAVVQGLAMILIGGVAAGLMWLCGSSLNDFKRPQDSLDYEN